MQRASTSCYIGHSGERPPGLCYQFLEQITVIWISTPLSLVHWDLNEFQFPWMPFGQSSFNPVSSSEKELQIPGPSEAHIRQDGAGRVLLLEGIFQPLHALIEDLRRKPGPTSQVRQQ